MNPSPTTKRGVVTIFFLSVLLSVLASTSVHAIEPNAGAAAAPATLSYKVDYGALKRVGTDLYEALKPKHRANLSPTPIWFKNEAKPYARPLMFQSENQPTRIVYISEGFVLFAEFVAHAKAIDKIEPGFFEAYVQKFSQLNEGTLVPEPPRISDPRYWTDDIINEQTGYFSQIIACVASIEMAHHYLGNYDRYASQLVDSLNNPVTMATVCTASQWDSAMKLGAADALECGYAFDGLKALYECIDRMSRRPKWTYYFLPPIADVNRIERDLDRIESSFFGQK